MDMLNFSIFRKFPRDICTNSGYKICEGSVQKYIKVLRGATKFLEKNIHFFTYCHCSSKDCNFCLNIYFRFLWSVMKVANNKSSGSFSKGRSIDYTLTIGRRFDRHVICFQD